MEELGTERVGGSRSKSSSSSSSSKGKATVGAASLPQCLGVKTLPLPSVPLVVAASCIEIVLLLSAPGKDFIFFFFSLAGWDTVGGWLSGLQGQSRNSLSFFFLCGGD